MGITVKYRAHQLISHELNVGCVKTHSEICFTSHKHINSEHDTNVYEYVPYVCGTLLRSL